MSSFRGSNLVIFLLLLAMQPPSVFFFGFLLGILFLIPFLSAPLDKIPPERLAVWPVPGAGGRLLRMFTFRPRLGRWNMRWPAIPHLPFLRKDVGQLFLSFDTWLAVLFSASCTGYRLLAAAPEPAAYPVMACVTVIMLSTQSQCLFGLDGAGGLDRYRLLPLPVWRILAYKGVAFLVVTLLLTAPLAPVAGAAAALATLAVGNYPSLFYAVAQTRWRFAQGIVAPWGVLQAVGIFAFGIAAGRGLVGAFWFAAALYGVSLVAMEFRVRIEMKRTRN